MIITFFTFEDRSNSSLAYLRNRIRLTLTPYSISEGKSLNLRASLSLADEIALYGESIRGVNEGDITITDLSVFQQQTNAVQHLLIQSYFRILSWFYSFKRSVQSIDESFLRKKTSGKDATKKWLRISQTQRTASLITKEEPISPSPSLLEFGKIYCVWGNTYWILFLNHMSFLMWILLIFGLMPDSGDSS